MSVAHHVEDGVPRSAVSNLHPAAPTRQVQLGDLTKTKPHQDDTKTTLMDGANLGAALARSIVSKAVIRRHLALDMSLSSILLQCSGG